jgi:hypothetical protein
MQSIGTIAKKKRLSLLLISLHSLLLLRTML